jgi:hypothetical protein
MPDEIFHLDTLKMFTLNSYNLTWWVYTNNQLRSIDGLAPVTECEINSLEEYNHRRLTLATPSLVRAAYDRLSLFGPVTRSV